MTYKEKHSHHLHSAFNVLVVSVAMLITIGGCVGNKEKSDKQQEQGLIDKTPVQTRDKYDAKVTLYLVDVPVYAYSGERKEGQYIVTRGLQKSEYAPGVRRYTRKAYFNNSNDAVYVQVDDNNAIMTERGFVGLFVDSDGKAVVVSDEHVTDFVRDRTTHHNDTRDGRTLDIGERVSKIRQQMEENDSTKLNIAADSIHTDTVKLGTDSVASPRLLLDTNTTPTDTLTVIHQGVREQNR